MLKLWVIAFLATTLLACRHGGKKITPSKRPPNILFIMSDDHTAQAWGIYGGILRDYVKNKHLKRLASEGAVLNNAFCTNSICVPSRATILTGQYSHKNGVYTLADTLNPARLNIAKLLRKQGYQTAIIGKWHLKSAPSGFDHYNVLNGQGRYWNPILRTQDNFYKEAKDWDVHRGFSTDVVTDLSMHWLDTINKDKPFMLMTHFKATHEPFDYPTRHKDLYKDVNLPEPASLLDFSPKTTGRTFQGQQLSNLEWRWKQAFKNPDKWWCKYPGLPFVTEGMDSIARRRHAYQKLVKDFLRCGAAIDDNIGRLLDHLAAKGLADNTVVIYTADQGYFLGEHGFFDKRLIYEESLRMPFVIRYPKEIKGGQRIDDLILNIDFASLIADYAGITLPKSFQGRSFRENLKGNTPKDWRTCMYYRYWLHETIRPAHFGIRNHRYKLIYFYGEPLDMKGVHKKATPANWEFYDLQKDPKENHNAYHDAACQSIIKEMKRELVRQRTLFEDTDNKYPQLKAHLQAELE